MLLLFFQVKLESNFASIVFAIMVLEGLGRSLDPNLDILDLAKPLLLKNCASLIWHTHAYKRAHTAQAQWTTHRQAPASAYTATAAKSCMQCTYSISINTVHVYPPNAMMMGDTMQDSTVDHKITVSSLHFSSLCHKYLIEFYICGVSTFITVTLEFYHLLYSLVWTFHPQKSTSRRL